MNSVHADWRTDRDPRQDFFDLMDSADRDRADEIWRFIYLVQEAAAAIPGPRDDVDDFTDGFVSIDLSGFGTAGQRLLIPAALLYGVEPRFVPAIVESYVEAFKTGGRRAS